MKEDQEYGMIAFLEEPKKIVQKRYPLPEKLEAGALLLRVLQTNVCGSDIHIFNGDHPLIKRGGMGHEMVGEVLKLGEGVITDYAGQPVAVGDRVVPVYVAACGKCFNCNSNLEQHCVDAFKYWGKTEEPPYFHGATFSTHYYLHSDQAFYKVPDSVSTEAAASANCALSQAIYGVYSAGVKAGDMVVVLGAGGLGLSSAAASKVEGAKVVIIDLVDERLELAKKFGVDHCINSKGLSDNDLIEKIQSLNEGRLANVVIEATGVPDVFSKGINYITEGGTLLVMGTISPGKTTLFDPGSLVRKSGRIMGVNRYPAVFLKKSLDFLENTQNVFPFEELFDQSFDLCSISEAIQASADRKINRAQIKP